MQDEILWVVPEFFIIIRSHLQYESAVLNDHSNIDSKKH